MAELEMVIRELRKHGSVPRDWQHDAVVFSRNHPAATWEVYNLGFELPAIVATADGFEIALIEAPGSSYPENMHERARPDWRFIGWRYRIVVMNDRRLATEDWSDDLCDTAELALASARRAAEEA